MLQSIKNGLTEKVRSQKLDDKPKMGRGSIKEPSFDNERKESITKSSSVFTRLRFGSRRQTPTSSPPPKAANSKANKDIEGDNEYSVDRNTLSINHSTLRNIDYKNTSSIAESVKLRRSLNQGAPLTPLNTDNTLTTSRRKSNKLNSSLSHTSNSVEELEPKKILLDSGKCIDVETESCPYREDNGFELLDDYFSDSKSHASPSQAPEPYNESANASYDAIYPPDMGDIPQFICDFGGSNDNEEALRNSLFEDFSKDVQVLDVNPSPVTAAMSSLELSGERDSGVEHLKRHLLLATEVANGDDGAVQSTTSLDDLYSRSADSSMSCRSADSMRPNPKRSTSRREIVSTAVKLSTEYLPPVTKPYVLGAEPYLAQGAEILEIIVSILMIFLELTYELCMFVWALIQPFHSDLVVLLPSFMGLIVCFFGGSFMTIISAVEAYRLCGYETTLHGLSQIYEDLQRVYKSYNEQKAELEKGRQQELQEEQRRQQQKQNLRPLLVQQPGGKEHTAEQEQQEEDSAAKAIMLNASSCSFSASSDASADDQAVSIVLSGHQLDDGVVLDTTTSSSYGTSAICKSPERFHMADPSKTSHEQHVDMAVIFLRTVDPNKFVDALVGVSMCTLCVFSVTSSYYRRPCSLGQPRIRRRFGDGEAIFREDDHPGSIH